MEHFAQDITLKPSESVREIESQDGAVLLDIEHRVCLSMTLVELQVWRQIKASKTPDQIVDYLLTQFHDVARGQIRQDVVQFISGLGQTGVLTSKSGPRPAGRSHRFLALLWPRQRSGHDLSGASPRTKRFLVWRALLGLLLFDLLRIGRDFNEVQAVVKDWPVAKCAAVPDVVNRICAAINYARVWYPKYVLCSQRSAVTTCLLRSCGVSAHMVVGAQQFPFKAHAWTEVNGHPINERRDVHRLYLVWERC